MCLEKIVKLNLKDLEYYSEPFPHAIFTNVLIDDDLEKIVSNFPKNTEKFQKVMGGRLRVSSDTTQFYDFLSRFESWSRLYSTFNSNWFAQFVVDLFSNDISKYNPNGNFTEFTYDENWLREKISARSERLNLINRSQVHEVKTTDLLTLISSRIGQRVFNRLGLHKTKSLDEFYLHMDISEANEGYTREIHHDNDDRFAAMVFYLSDMGSMVGGEFGIHKYSDNRPLEMCEPHPKQAETELVRLIEPKKNTLVLFLSTPNSYHSVPLVTSATESRKFFYAGITVKKRNAWKNTIPTKT